MKHFHLGAISGIIAAAQVDNAVLFSFRNSAANSLHLQRLRVSVWPVTLPTALQELIVSVPLALFGDDYTDGQNLSDPATAANYAIRNRNLDKQRVLQSSWRPVSSLASGNARIAATAGLTAGASPPTIDAHAFIARGAYYTAAGAAIGGGNIELLWESPTLGQEHERPDVGGIPLEQNRGLVIRLPAPANDAGFTFRIAVELDWIET